MYWLQTTSILEEHVVGHIDNRDYNLTEKFDLPIGIIKIQSSGSYYDYYNGENFIHWSPGLYFDGTDDELRIELKRVKNEQSINTKTER